MEVTRYLKTYRLTARELAMRMILDVLSDDRHHRHRRDRDESVSVQGRHGHRG